MFNLQKVKVYSLILAPYLFFVFSCDDATTSISNTRSAVAAVEEMSDEGDTNIVINSNETDPNQSDSNNILSCPIDDGITDSDSDLIVDSNDACPCTTIIDSNDYDSNGCSDEEDDDDDKDGVHDDQDKCYQGVMGWLSDSNTDYDGDGCLDYDLTDESLQLVEEDFDDDEDGVDDKVDTCDKGDKEWVSDSNTDFDNDGCQDIGEDKDDDNDSISDVVELYLGTDSKNKSLCGDSDGDTCDDCSSGGLPDTQNDGTDTNLDGMCDKFEESECKEIVSLDSTTVMDDSFPFKLEPIGSLTTLISKSDRFDNSSFLGSQTGIRLSLKSGDEFSLSQITGIFVSADTNNPPICDDSETNKWIYDDECEEGLSAEACSNLWELSECKSLLSTVCQNFDQGKQNTDACSELIGLHCFTGLDLDCGTRFLIQGSKAGEIKEFSFTPKVVSKNFNDYTINDMPSYDTDADNFFQQVKFLNFTTNGAEVDYKSIRLEYSVCNQIDPSEVSQEEVNPDLDSEVSVTEVTLEEIVISSNLIKENSSKDSIVGELSVSGSTDEFTFSLMAGHDDSFVISGNQLYTNGGLDFETKSKYELVIKATGVDDEYNVKLGVIEIEVENVNETIEQLILISNTFSEHYKDIDGGRIVGEVLVFDPDTRFSDLSLEVSGEDSQFFEIDVDNELHKYYLKIEEDQTFDFETQSTFDITLKAKDTTDKSHSKEKSYVLELDTDFKDLIRNLDINQEAYALSSNMKHYRFNSQSTFEIKNYSESVKVLLVGGGGGGGKHYTEDWRNAGGGGGGGGGVKELEVILEKGFYKVTIGQGGNGSNDSSYPLDPGENGGPSYISYRQTENDAWNILENLQVNGGGGGGSSCNTNKQKARNVNGYGVDAPTEYGGGGNGGGGGGACIHWINSGYGSPGGSGDNGGKNGGRCKYNGGDGCVTGGGGGGAGGNGTDTILKNRGGDGGAGIKRNYTGVDEYFGSGGGGGGSSFADGNTRNIAGGIGANGVGGHGGNRDNKKSQPGSGANGHGGGGGGGSRSADKGDGSTQMNGGRGGSGTIIIGFKGAFTQN